MALLFAEGFDLYKTAAASDLTTQLPRHWTSVSAFAVGGIAAGRFGGSCLGAVGGSGGNARKDVTAAATLLIGFAFKQSAAAGGTFFDFLDGSSVQVGLLITAAGKIALYRGVVGTVIATGTTVLSSSNWYYIELKITFNNSGTYELRIDGRTEISGSADTTNTANSTSSGFRLNAAAVQTVSFDDLYLIDTTGSVNNDFLGDRRIVTLQPSGAGTTTQFTPSTGSNFQNVDETAANDDTDYNGSSTVNQKDSYALADLPAGVTTINAVQNKCLVRKDDAGGRRVKALLLSGATEDLATEYDLTQSYIYTSKIYETNPNTAGAWSSSTVNALEAGVKVTL